MLDQLLLTFQKVEHERWTRTIKENDIKGD